MVESKQRPKKPYPSLDETEIYETSRVHCLSVKVWKNKKTDGEKQKKKRDETTADRK